MTENITITFKHKILRSNTNNNISVPTLTYLNFVLNKIVFKTDCWDFEAVVKSGQTDLIKLTPTYFQHYHHLDLENVLYKIEEGDHITLVIKPKHAPKDFILNIDYTYQPSQGYLYFQSTHRLSDLEDNNCTVLEDITQHTKPTRLEIKTDGDIQSLTLKPNFKSNHFQNNIYQITPNSNNTIIDFLDEDFPTEILNLLKYYQLDIEIDTKNTNLDTPLHFLAYGFKST